MTDTRQITNLLYRLFLCSWIFAVMWVKGYLWSILGLGVFLILMDRFLALQFFAASANGSASETPRPKQRGGRPKKVDQPSETSWREPRPQWSEPPSAKT